MKISKKLINKEITLQQFIGYIKEGYRQFENIEIQDTGTMHNWDLSGIILEKCYLSLDFTGAIFTQAIFTGCNLKASIFQDTDLKFSQFTDCVLCSTDFKNANVEGLVFEGNYFHSTILSVSDLYRMVREE